MVLAGQAAQASNKLKLVITALLLGLSYRTTDNALDNALTASSQGAIGWQYRLSVIARALQPSSAQSTQVHSIKNEIEKLKNEVL